MTKDFSLRYFERVLELRKLDLRGVKGQFDVKKVRLAMVPRNSQLILFETYIQHQQFLMTKNKISPSIQIYKELKTVSCNI